MDLAPIVKVDAFDVEHLNGRLDPTGHYAHPFAAINQTEPHVGFFIVEAAHMPTLIDPRIVFSEWVPWQERHGLKQTAGPWLGVYLWAHFKRPPASSVRPYPDLPREVIYVGEAKDLDRRPLTGRHHRLRHYIDTFSNDPEYRQLYVSVSRVQQFRAGYGSKKALASYARLRVYTQFVETRLYWEYTQRWGCPPALHYKKGRDD